MMFTIWLLLAILNDILCEYNVHTAGQLVNRVYDVFTAAEQ